MTKRKRRIVIALEDFCIRNEHGLEDVSKGTLIEVDDDAFNKFVNLDKLCKEYKVNEVMKK